METRAALRPGAAVLTASEMRALHAPLGGRLLAVCFGAGVDSTAMLVALHEAGLRPAVITFADTGGEKPETLAHVDAINGVLHTWGWPQIAVCRKVPLASTGYADLYGNCVKNETLPSLAFGLKSCSLKWKTVPQDQFIRGKSGPNAHPPHPVWIEAQRTGQRILKLIGYDAGRADLRRSKNLAPSDAHFDYAYPLQTLGWTRPDCVRAITQALGATLVPLKSACTFCPASKPWELYWLAANHPALLEEALELERRALTGKHSRFDAVRFGASWEAIVRSHGRFPSGTSTVGLGRSFSWNQWAWTNGVVDADFRVRGDAADRERFALLANTLRHADNALDARSCGGEARQMDLFALAE